MVNMNTTVSEWNITMASVAAPKPNCMQKIHYFQKAIVKVATLSNGLTYCKPGIYPVCYRTILIRRTSDIKNPY